MLRTACPASENLTCLSFFNLSPRRSQEIKDEIGRADPGVAEVVLENLEDDELQLLLFAAKARLSGV